MTPEWRVSPRPVPYEEALARMEARVAAIRAGTEPELLWLLEHPPLYTAGTSARKEDLLNPQFPVYATGRGGQYTYHGPGQRVVYVMLDLQRRMQGSPDLRRFVWLLEEWILRTLAAFGVKGERREGRVGIWVSAFNEGGLAPTASLPPPAHAASHLLGSSPPVSSEAKIAALGIRIRRGVSYHGIALNLNPDLSHYAGIVPCGIRDHGVTSLHALRKQVTLAELDRVLEREFLCLPWNH